jgi:hypothetical protein
VVEIQKLIGFTLEPLGAALHSGNIKKGGIFPQLIAHKSGSFEIKGWSTAVKVLVAILIMYSFVFPMSSLLLDLFLLSYTQIPTDRNSPPLPLHPHKKTP